MEIAQNLKNKPIGIYINNNVWDFIYERLLDLSLELPREEFCICITREAEFEIPTIKDIKLIEFIQKTIEKCVIKTDVTFGFHNDNYPRNEQRVGGFGSGRFVSQQEADFRKQQRTPLQSVKKLKNGLYKNEADISLGARSFHSVVLSLDKKSGPINNAYKQGGKVIFLTDFDKTGLSLSDYIKRNL